MNRLFAAGCGAVASLAFAAPALAENAPNAGDAPIDAVMLERDVTILSHDNMEGREAGTRGHERAAGYVAGRLAALGLEPAGDDGTYFQAVPMQLTEHGEDGNSLAIKGLGRLTAFEDYYLSGTAQQETGTLEAEMVFIGYGLDLPGRDDFAGVDLEGKIALRVYGGPSSLDSEEAAHYRSTLNQRLSDRGAVGSLLLWTPHLEDSFAWEDSAEDARHGLSMTWLDKQGAPYSAAPGLLATGGLSARQSRALLEGQAFDYDDVVAAEQTGDKSMPSFATGHIARMEFTSTFSRITTPNVVATLRGTDPSVADQHIVLTAHLDHVGVQHTDVEGDDEIYNGALDNAVGVASMIEVARLLAANPPRRPVMFIALTAEEKGLLGSSYNAANPTVPADQVAANLNLDMPFVNFDFTDVVAFGAQRSNLYPQVLAAVEEAGMALSPDMQPEQGFFTRSDQYSYVRSGVPAIFLDTGWSNGGEDAQEEFLENHYHQVSDEVELVNFASLQRFTALNYAIARNIANMDARPQWNEGDFFGETFGRPTIAE